MFPRSDNIFTSRPGMSPALSTGHPQAAPAPGKSALAATGLLAAAGMLAVGLALLACSAAPVKMECREIQMRIDYGDLTADQLRFAMQELEACHGRQKAAEARDSALIEGTEQRFTPEAEAGP